MQPLQRHPTNIKIPVQKLLQSCPSRCSAASVLYESQRLFDVWGFFFFISAASDFKLNLRCCIYSKNSGIVTAQHYRLCSHQPTPFLSPLFSRSISLTPFSLSGCTSACRSGYLIHVQRHRFLIL